MKTLNSLVSKYSEGGRARREEEEEEDTDDDSAETIYKALGGPVQGEEEVTPPAAPHTVDISAGVPNSMADHLSSAISAAGPDASPILKAHALALLRANLNAAHAIHTLTGDPSAYGHYQQGARALSQALGGNNDSITAQMIAQQGTGDMNPMALAPAAITAANLAVPQRQS